eukprot:800015-Rhodomonas_salina.2
MRSLSECRTSRSKCKGCYLMLQDHLLREARAEDTLTTIPSLSTGLRVSARRPVAAQISVLVFAYRTRRPIADFTWNSGGFCTSSLTWGTTIRDVTPGHRIAISYPYHCTLYQDWESQHTLLYAKSVPGIA